MIKPGVYDNGTAPNGTSPHNIGTVMSSEDFGHGGCALAVKVNATATGADIYLGTFTTHPQQLNPNVPLSDAGVLTGSVQKFEFTPGSPGNLVHKPTQSIILSPSALDPRGGFGVVGLCVADLLPAVAGDELIVTTLAGDLFVYNLGTQPNALPALLFRTWVPGNLGCYNSILVKDLDQDTVPELYIASSMGIYRFH